jgi:hypothetical protein
MLPIDRTAASDEMKTMLPSSRFSMSFITVRVIRTAACMLSPWMPEAKRRLL